MDWSHDGDDWGSYVAQHRADEDAERRHETHGDAEPDCDLCEAALRDAAMDAEDDEGEE